MATDFEKRQADLAQRQEFDLDKYDPMMFDTTGFDPYKPAVGLGITEKAIRRGVSADRVRKGDFSLGSTRGLAYDPNDLSDAGFKKTQEAFSTAYGLASSVHGNMRTQAAVARNFVFQDYAAASKQYYNLKAAGAQADAQTKRVQQQQRDAQRKQQEGGEEGSKPKGKATVLTGSNIPVRTARRTSSSTPVAKAGRTARFKSPGVNI